LNENGIVRFYVTWWKISCHIFMIFYIWVFDKLKKYKINLFKPKGEEGNLHVVVATWIYSWIITLFNGKSLDLRLFSIAGNRNHVQCRAHIFIIYKGMVRYYRYLPIYCRACRRFTTHLYIRVDKCCST